MRLNDFVKRFRGPILIIFIVLVANFLYISGIFKSNPTDLYSGVVSFTHVGAVMGQPTIDPNNAFTTQALGHTAARDILHGKLPWWNYDEQIGAPLAGEMQSGALFLPFNLLLAFGDGVLYFHIVLQIIAGVAAYYLLKRLRVKDPVAITGGALFAINGTFVWLTNAAFNPIAFLPVMLLGVEMLFEDYKKKKNLGIILIAVGLAYSLYAGFPEVAYIDAILVGIWSLARIIQQKEKEWWILALKCIAGIVAGLALAAPILVAFKDYLPSADVGIHSGAASSFALPHKGIVALLFPYSYGSIFGLNGFDKTGILSSFWDNVGGYLSLPIVFLAMVGVLKYNRNRLLVTLLAVWSVIITMRIYGFFGIYHVMRLVPGMSSVAFYRYAPPSLELSVIVLAMLGLNEIISHKISKKFIMKISLSMVIIVLGLALVALKEEHNLYLAPHHRLWLAASFGWGLACFGSIVIIITTSLKQWAKVLIPAILVVDALVMFIIPQLSAPRQVILDTAPVTFLQNNLGNERFYGLGTILPNYGSYYNVASINTNDLPISKQWSKYVLSSLDPNTDPISAFTGQNQVNPLGITPQQAFFKYFKDYEKVGVKYVVIHPGSFTSTDIKDYGLKLAFSDDLYQIYQLPAPTPYLTITSGTCAISMVSINEIKSDCKSTSTLIRNELYMPGWEVKVNNRYSAVQYEKPLFQKVNLPKGKSVVVFRFRPQHARLAEIVAVAGLLALIGLLLDQKFYLLDKLK